MVQVAAGRDGALQAANSGTGRVTFAVTLAVLAVYMAAGHWSGNAFNTDADDLLKLHEIRSFLHDPAIFDRTLPGVLQPEPYVSHWPWIIDLPYAVVAWLLSPFVGPQSGISAAVVVVPLLLLIPAFACYDRLVGAAGFSDRTVALPLAAFVALPGFLEFAPGRIDYHNLQILLLLAGIVLLLREGRGAAFGNGLAVALATAISPEFVGFHLLLMGFYAFDHVFDRPGGPQRMAWFGVGLALAAVVLLAATVPPERYTAGRCDTYSAPFAITLFLAGTTFAILPGLVRSKSWVVRATALAACAAAALLAVIALYPDCLGGPYAALDPAVRDYFLGSIGQEMSFFQRSDFVLSDSLPMFTIMLIGALAPMALYFAGGRRDRVTIAIAMFSLLAVLQAVFYFRYLRYVPFFSGIGIAVVVAALLPPDMARRLRLDCPLSAAPWRRLLIPAPGIALALFFAGYHVAAGPSRALATVTDIAGAGCAQLNDLPPYDWPQGSVVLAPPLLGARLLAATNHPAVVATPHHPAARGIGRIGRFFDPRTDDPRVPLEETRANLVAVCSWPADLPASFADRYPFTASLMKGTAPQWLGKCPSDETTSLRLYSYKDAPCPSARQ